MAKPVKVVIDFVAVDVGGNQEFLQSYVLFENGDSLAVAFMRPSRQDADWRRGYSDDHDGKVDVVVSTWEVFENLPVECALLYG